MSGKVSMRKAILHRSCCLLRVKAGVSWPCQEGSSDPLQKFFAPGSVSDSTTARKLTGRSSRGTGIGTKTTSRVCPGPAPT